MTELAPVLVGAAPLSPADVVAVVRHDAPVQIDAEALARVADTRRVIDGLAADPNPHYGVSTGFGPSRPRSSLPTAACSCRPA